MKQHGRPPPKHTKSLTSPTSPFTVFPHTDTTVPDLPPGDLSPVQPGDSYIQPYPHQLWGHPGVQQPIRVLLRPEQPGLGQVILPKHVPVVVRPWGRPPMKVEPQAAWESQNANIVDKCLRRLENLLTPIHNTCHQMMEMNERLYRQNINMAYTIGQCGLPPAHVEPPTPVNEETWRETDPYADDDYTNASARGSGGTGGNPVVVIQQPKPAPKRVRLKVKQPDKKQSYDKDDKDDDKTGDK